jgi:starch-binding outer membrane protein, SusD/RagB family
MKKIIIKTSIAFSALVFIMSSCSKFLQEAPEGLSQTQNYYKTPTDAANALTAAYFLLNAGGNAVQTPYNTLFNTGLNFMADDEFPGPGATNPDVRSMANLLHTSTNLRVYELWQQHYAAIFKANTALNKVPQISLLTASGFNAALRDRYLAEAKFLRALFYFNLVRLYGDVPLIKDVKLPTDAASVVDYSYYNGVQSSTYQVQRTSSDTVYAHIVRDLLDAAKVLPNSYTGGDLGRATRGAANALLSKVYLTWAGFPLQRTQYYQKAVDFANAVIPTADGGLNTFSGYSLETTYANVFLPAQKFTNKEQIFSAQFRNGSAASSTFNTQGNNQNPRSIRTNVPGLTGAYADQTWFYPVNNDNYYSVFKLYAKKTVGTVTGVAVDKRRDVTFVTNYKSPTNGKYYGDLNDPTVNTGSKLDSVPYFNKYWDPAAANGTVATSESGANVPIIRYADVLLIKAEALNELGQSGTAYNSLQLIRKRAGLGTNGDGSLKGGIPAPDALRDSIYLDRRLEFVFEYQRWFDLVRQRDAAGNNIFVKSLQAVKKFNAADKHRLHPIPQQEIGLNPALYQNPGY